MAGDGEEREIGLSGTRLMVRKVRKDGWTKKKRGIFLDTLAACCNVRTAVKTAGVNITSAYSLRRREPEFAEHWDAALAAGHATLMSMLLERAMRGETEPAPEGDVAPPDPATMDTTLALQLLKFHHPAAVKKGGRRVEVTTAEETNAAIIARLHVLRKRGQI